MNAKLTQERLKEVMHFDESTGVLTWANPSSVNSRVRKGDVAGCIDSEGYRVISIDGKAYKAHRLAWLYVYGKFPSGVLSHVSGDRSDNRVANLREYGGSSKAPLTQKRLKAVLEYDPKTGVFTWVAKTSGSSNYAIGSKAGNPTPEGYWKICIDGKAYKAHRLAYLYMTGAWPKEEVDHISHDKMDNAFSNLRESSRADNARNLPPRIDNSSGFVGVSWHRKIGKWTAYINYEGARKHLGYFADKDEAAASYRLAAETLGFHNNHGLNVGASK
jgi:hypothetical protein